MRLDDLLRLYIASNLNLKPNSADQLKYTLASLAKHLSRPPTVDDLNSETVIPWLRDVASARSIRTANNQRSNLLTLWRFAAEPERNLAAPPPKIARIREVKRIPEAWTVGEMARLINECRRWQPPAGKRWASKWANWDGRCWAALVQVIYDTSLRIGCLLSSKPEQLRPDGFLFVPGELQKGKQDTLHKLHANTIADLQATVSGGRLFPWPVKKRRIWFHFREILKAAGLPSDRRCLFHRLRRTSYTQVYVTLGPEAATRHAAHTSDLSRLYLDPRALPMNRHAADAIPRPA